MTSIKIIFIIGLFLLPISIHANEKDEDIEYYYKKLDMYNGLNKKNDCGFTGFRWLNPKIWQLKEKWIRQQNNDFFAKEIYQLQQRIEECKAKKHIPIIAKNGKKLQDFIPNNWIVLSNKIYEKQFPYSKIVAFSPIKQPFSLDFNQDQQQDIVAVIGRKTLTDIGFDDFRLLILRGTNNGYELAYNLKLGLHDLPLSGDDHSSTLLAAKFSVVANEDKKSFHIHNWLSYDHNNLDSQLSIHFSAWRNQLVISRYTLSSMTDSFYYTEYPSVLSFNYDFEKKLLKTYDARNMGVKSCTDDATVEEAMICPDIIRTTATFFSENNKRIKITDLIDISPINWQKDYGIKVKKVIDDKSDFCKNYAEKSLKAENFNQKYQCGFAGLRWNSDKQGQEKWCLTVKMKIAQSETDIRTARISECASSLQR